MDRSLPSSSTVTIYLSHDDYDLAQLSRAIVSVPFDPEPIPESCVHLHTCLIQATLTPPPETEQYHDGPRPHPLYAPYSAALAALRTHTPAYTPLPISSPRAALRTPLHSDRVHPSRSADVFLPNSHRRRPLVHLPVMFKGQGKSWSPSSTAWDMDNWLHAALALDPDLFQTRRGYRDDQRRLYLRTSIKVSWTPKNDVDDPATAPDQEVEIQAVFETTVHVDPVALLAPLPPIGADLLGLVLHSLIPSPTDRTFVSASEARAVGLHDFFAALKPAPDLALTMDARQLQPDGMTCRLLPFQKRTLAWLLQREANGPARGKPTHGFWDVGDLGGPKAYRRITGEIMTIAHDDKGKGKEVDVYEGLPDLVDLAGVRGAMLCEEMGLGKTVEAIALILLHRHPLSVARDMTAVKADVPAKLPPLPVLSLASSVPGLQDDGIMEWLHGEKAAFEKTSVWDEQSQLSVTSAAATLVVTPPSLLKQWVSEMARHAPKLRVCVYPGWKTLQVEVEKLRAASRRRAKIDKDKTMQAEARAFLEKTRRKYAMEDKDKSVTGGKRKRADDVQVKADEDSKAEDNDDSLLHLVQRGFIDYVRAHDVVITTYQTLADDLKVALPVPPRSRRSTADYKINERPRSPLVMVEWWRVIMDEVQLQSDSSAAAEMVSLIPRNCSLAVSGTPARSDIKDLMGSLRFLRVPVLPRNNVLWHRLQQPAFRPAFDNIFSRLAVRTTKAEVSGEFNLPNQTRVVVPISLSPIEMHYYLDTLTRQRERLGLPGDVTQPPAPDWLLDGAKFRICLRHLRQICTHIQVGFMQTSAPLGRAVERMHLGRELMTMEEALRKMTDEHTSAMVLSERQLMRTYVRKGKLTVMNGDSDLRHLNALLAYDKAKASAEKQLQALRAELRAQVGDREGTVVTIDSDEADGDDADGQQKFMSQAEKEKKHAVNVVRNAIRDVLLVLHQSWFFTGDIRHDLKEEELEIEAYARAEEIRREILSRPLQAANASIGHLERVLARGPALRAIEELMAEKRSRPYGLQTKDAVASIEALWEVLADNATLVYSWREKIIRLLKLPIETEDKAVAEDQGQDIEDPEAEYYAESLKAQGEIDAYLGAYAAAIADRREMMLEDRSSLAEHDGKQKKKRTTQRAKDAGEVGYEAVPGETDELLAELMSERVAFKEGRKDKDCERPLKAYLMDLNTIVMGVARPEEMAIAKGMQTEVRAFISKQTELVEKLNKELDVFRATFNRRVVYFAALQDISDSVAAPLALDIHSDIRAAESEIKDLDGKLSGMTRKARFLASLAGKDADDVRDECSICFGTSDDRHAYILSCGHSFCVSCFRAFRRAQHIGNKCPSCKVGIDERAMTKVSLGVPQARALGGATAADGDATAEESLEDLQEQERRRRAEELGRLKIIENDKHRAVAGFDIMGDWGSKIDFLVKHLLWYRSTEPATRHVVFSNWADSLHIVERALAANKIKFVSLGSGRKVADAVEAFHADPAVSVFLLHAERESAGLTLTSCRVVHLLEPVLQHSFELQAIGRVDRLGQKQQTTVYCYATMDTVEARVLAQGVRNGTSIYLGDDAAGEASVRAMPNVASAAQRGGDLSAEGNEHELVKLIM